MLIKQYKLICLTAICLSFIGLTACSAPSGKPYEVVGHWIYDLDDKTMLDPQTSGLIAEGEYLLTIADASADETQQKRLIAIDRKNYDVAFKSSEFTLSNDLTSSCFASYLNGEPDYEALVEHPLKDNAWIIVTEDATRGKPLSPDCQLKYGNTGSTQHPTLLVELSSSSDSRDASGDILVTGIRPVQFDIADNVGDFPNDGIEGLAVSKDGKLFLGLEKDANTQPRVFQIQLTADFFNSQEFAQVADAKLKVPTFTSGNHPINALTMHYPSANSSGFLLAAARNDNQLWIIDLAGDKDTKIIDFAFMATAISSECKTSPYKLDNASIEGIAVSGDTLFMVNDPWRRNYKKNIICEQDEEAYLRMSPLMFVMEMPSEWFN